MTLNMKPILTFFLTFQLIFLFRYPNNRVPTTRTATPPGTAACSAAGRVCRIWRTAESWTPTPSSRSWRTKTRFPPMSSKSFFRFVSDHFLKSTFFHIYFYDQNCVFTFHEQINISLIHLLIIWSFPKQINPRCTVLTFHSITTHQHHSRLINV
jgi:hypothetical protein